MPGENCFQLPPEFSPNDGAMLEPLGIAIHAVDLAHLKPGFTVAVLGAGPIGLLIAGVARAAGASTIIMTEPLAYRRDFALSYIADVVFNPEKEDFLTEINQFTNGRGVDIVFEAAGAPETPQNASEIVRYGGKVIVAGIPSDDAYSFPASTVRRKGLTIKLVRRMKHTYPRAIKMVQSGLVDVKSLVTHHFPLEKLSNAMDLVAEYNDGVIKAMIQIE
jgi:L-iditol 2-dehydrogenase